MRICRSCVAAFKASGDGKRLIKQWRREGIRTRKWPSFVYHNGQYPICADHLARQRTKTQKVYDERNGVVRQLGFENYAAYQKSGLWLGIRQRVRAAFGDLCEFCEVPGNQVHHANYSEATLRGETLRYLYGVCSTCHRLGEFEDDGTKCSPKRATARMRDRACEAGHGKWIRARERVREQLRDVNA